MVRDVIEELAS